MNITKGISILLAAGLMAACSGGEKTDERQVRESASGRVEAQQTAAVETKTDPLKAVADGLTSKGVIHSRTDVPVYTLVSAPATRVNIQEGMKVHQGQVLLELDKTELTNNITRVLNENKAARFQFESIIVGQGYDPNKLQEIPEQIVEAARIRSNLKVTEDELKMSQGELEKTIVKAPVSGVVTDVSIHHHELARQGETLCRIIDPEDLTVVFTILENVASQFTIGTEVKVSTVAYPDEFHKATIFRISPKVDEQGMITLEAALEDSRNLLTGMTAIVTTPDKE